MQYSTIGDAKVSRLGIGTKRFPMQNETHVERLDHEQSNAIAEAAFAAGINFFDTSYSTRKGEAEVFLGELEKSHPGEFYVATNYFEMVDPRFEYVFQKQLKKLGTDCIDFYTIEGVCDLTYTRDIDSGAVDFLFKQKEEGKIARLGFSSELKAENLEKYAGLYPWDYVRMRVNYFDWFQKGAREQYEVATKAGLPIVAHAPLHVGNVDHLKPHALEVLKAANPERTSLDWALRFVKSLENVRTVTCNVHSAKAVEENAAVFNDDVVLTEDEFAVLEETSAAQKLFKPRS